MTFALKRAKKLREAGSKIGRDGMSLRVIHAVAAFNARPTYKGAMILAGRLKAIAQMANSDEYWREQIDKGFNQEFTDAI